MKSANDAIVKDATIEFSYDPDPDVSLKMQRDCEENNLAIDTTLQIGFYQMKTQIKSYCDEINLTIKMTLHMGF